MAYNIKQVGRPLTLVIGTPSCTIVPESWTPERSADIDKRYSGNKRYPRTTIGNAVDTITITTTDLTKYSTLPFGLNVSSVVLTAEAPLVGNDAGAIGLEHATVWTFSISYGVVEVSKVEPAEGGKPAVWTLTITACETDAGADPTVTCDFV